MDLLSIGNLGGYIKNLKLQSQWTLKQQTGDYTAKGKSLEDWLDSSQVQSSEEMVGDRGDDTLRKIHQKLEAGGKLTHKEREYLQAHDPEAYRDLVNQEREQKAYEEALRRCKTQEEADRLQLSRINASLTRVRAVEHDPHIPLSEKLKIAMTEKQRVDRVAESTRNFVASGEYARLPDRAEEIQANEDAVGLPVDSSQKEEGAPAPQPEKAASSEKTGEAPAAEPESQAESKVRRAKARAAYAAVSTPDQPFADVVNTRA